MDWWVGGLFAFGSTCFLVGPLPGLVELVGSAADATLFFVGSIFFTSAALLQAVEAADRLDRWSCVNLVGCIAFGISAIAAYVVPATGSALDLAAANAWTSFGALCFLVGAVLLLSARSD